MSFVKSKGFKYAKNLIIGAGAAVVLMGALFKLQSWPYASEMLIVGLSVEALIFLMLGVIGPDKDYYWEKLYPGLADYESNIAPLTAGDMGDMNKGLNSEVVESNLSGMLDELKTMSASLSSLKALQEIDFSGTSEQVRAMGSFYTRLNEAMADLSDSVEDTKAYKDQLAALNQNLGSLNSVYGNVLNAMSNIGKN
ncbi:MAG: gliding motility protein GldL [Saprospiraceae bacterium]|nr:gliding motility protein GldL [Saprospiraceae bacterium]